MFCFGVSSSSSVFTLLIEMVSYDKTMEGIDNQLIR